jgi:hypothetical protein
MYRASFIILYYDQQMHNYLTNCEIIVRMLVVVQNKLKTRHFLLYRDVFPYI